MNHENTTSLTMSHIMTPDMANFSGNVHGGHIMKMLDEVAFACASRYTRCYMVTLSADHVVFRKPIHVGDLVTFLASINYVGSTSMEIGIKVIAENLQTSEQRHAISCFFTFVAVDKNMKPKKIPPLTLTTEKQKFRFEEAKLRKDIRIKNLNEHQLRKQEFEEKHQ